MSRVEQRVLRWILMAAGIVTIWNIVTAWR